MWFYQHKKHQIKPLKHAEKGNGIDDKETNAKSKRHWRQRTLQKNHLKPQEYHEKPIEIQKREKLLVNENSRKGIN